MKTDNELIAEFMGYWYEKPNGMDFTYLCLTRDKGTNLERGDTLCTIGNERFDKSWDWLMPVVEKISQMSVAVEISFSLGVVCRICFKNRKNEFEWKSFEHTSSIHATYNAVVEFIKWYNDQNK